MRLTAILPLLALLLAPPAAQAIGCGSELGPGGHFILDRDLSCPGRPFAIHVISATLDMRGFTVSCDSTDQTVGILVEGVGAVVKNGTVTGCNAGFLVGGERHQLIGNKANNNLQGFAVAAAKCKLTRNEANHNVSGIRLAVGDGNTLTRNVADNNEVGFSIELSSFDTLTRNEASFNTEAGYRIQGGNNQLRSNTAEDNLQAGFVVDGDSNVLTRNHSDRHGLGFDIRGDANELARNTAGKNEVGFITRKGADRNTLTRNRATGSDDDGIFITSEFNTVTRNTTTDGQYGIRISDATVGNQVIANHARGNTDLDLGDSNNECSSNSWKRNAFGTRDPDCIR